MLCTYLRGICSVISQFSGGGSIAEELGQARVSKPKRLIGRVMLKIDLPH